MDNLCIDPGLTKTGVAVVAPNRALVRWDEFGTDPKDALGYRIECICKWISAFVYDGSWPWPRLGYAFRIELLHGGTRPGDIARVLNFKNLRDLALLTGAIFNEACGINESAGIGEVRLVDPSVMRIAGRAVRREVKKKIARAIVAARYSQAIPEHAADAILLGAPATTAEIAAGWVKVQSGAYGKITGGTDEKGARRGGRHSGRYSRRPGTRRQG